MSIRIDEVLGVHAHALQLRLQRSEILAANLANEDTPAFQARDIDFAAEMRRVGQSESEPQLAVAGQDPRLLYRVPSQAAQDGNTVELSVEQAQFSRNAMDFQSSLAFLSMKVRGLKQAIEGR
jgi:flagellar basal-body rod protein FlgB